MVANPPSAASPAAPTIPALGTERTPAVNELRLTRRQWAATLTLLFVVATASPWLWQYAEPFRPGPDFRLPYRLSKDYWLYQRRLRQLDNPQTVVVLGDSVVWGEYVSPEGTLAHFLGTETGQPGRFANAGVNGLFPLALEGLVTHYAGALKHRKVVLQGNLLWLTSPKADLSSDKVEAFNHSRLVPQFVPRLPGYGADAGERLGAVVERHCDFFAWINHLESAYFDQHSIPAWTLADDGRDPPAYPNLRRCPVAAISLHLPEDPTPDSERGPASPRHRSWRTGGAAPTRFDWVSLESSLQWQAFQRTVGRLRSANNDVFVVLGPFNESMIAPDSLAPYQRIKAGAIRWLTELHVPFVAPDALPADLYADASHPLTEGYAQLARQLYADSQFQTWLKRP